MAEGHAHLAPPRVNEVISACAESLGVDLDAVELRGSGPKRLLRVVIDRDGGVSIDVITEVSRELSRELDRSAVMGETGYTLEVTSRGLSSPLTLPRHWQRNVGRMVVATLADGSRARGRIAAVIDGVIDGGIDGGVTLDDGSTWAFADVTKAVIEPELTKPKEHRDAH